METYLPLVLIILISHFLTETAVEVLNLRTAKTNPPDKLSDIYPATVYAASVDYLSTKTRFDLLQSSVSFPLILAFIFLGGFYQLYALVETLQWSPIPTGLLYAATLLLAHLILGLPANLYKTFVIEERFGFNKTTPRLFFTDLLKSLLIGALLGALTLSGLIWFFTHAGPFAWMIAWAAMSALQLFLVYAAPAWIMPLFNTYSPLKDGELRTAIERYASEQEFHLNGIFIMDGSKRSSKSNAFFTGFGKAKRIVLYDTLIERHPTSELVAILAHEMGHYKHRHIHSMIASSLVLTGLMLGILSVFLNDPAMYTAFGFPLDTPQDALPITCGLIFFGFLYTPLSIFFGVLGNVRSRKHEYQADAWASRTTGGPKPLIAALKRLSADNLSYLSPHPLKVFLEFSHPTLLQRIQRLESPSSD